jgi:hypothetical protein
MWTSANKILLIALILGGIFTTTDTLAEERIIQQDPAGFCISLPQVEPISLTQHIREWRASLEAQQLALEERIERLKFNTMDALITLVMPGGLLYAIVKRSKQVQRRETLSLLTRDIEQLTGDLQTLGSVSVTMQVAALDK